MTKWNIPDDAKPILFKGELVRAILAGRKTVTRRLVIPQPEPAAPEGCWRIFRRSGDTGYALAFDDAEARELLLERMPKRWEPMSTLYVREQLTFWPGHIRYAADEQQLFSIDDCVWFDRVAATRGSCPSIHAPRWTSRILLTVQEARPERLQEITADEVVREGFEVPDVDYSVPDRPWTLDAEREAFARQLFQAKWDGINKGRAAWASDPWLYRVQFGLKEVRTA